MCAQGSKSPFTFLSGKGVGWGRGLVGFEMGHEKKWHEIATKKSTRHQVITLQLFTLFTYLGLLLLPQAQIFVHRF